MENDETLQLRDSRYGAQKVLQAIDMLYREAKMLAEDWKQLDPEARQDVFDHMLDLRTRLDDAFDVAGEGPNPPLPATLVRARHFGPDEIRRACRAWPPPPEMVMKIQATMNLCDEIRDRCGFALKLRSLWRPADGDSMHRFGTAADLDIVDPDEAKIDRIRMVGATLWVDERINGLGIYHTPAKRIHVDMPHPGGKGHRYWHGDLVRPYLARVRSGERA